MLNRTRQFVLQQNVVILLLLLIVFFALTTGDLFLNGQNIHNVARQISFDIPLALALTIVVATIVLNTPIDGGGGLQPERLRVVQAGFVQVSIGGGG